VGIRTMSGGLGGVCGPPGCCAPRGAAKKAKPKDAITRKRRIKVSLRVIGPLGCAQPPLPFTPADAVIFLYYKRAGARAP